MTAPLVLLDNTVLSNFAVVARPDLVIAACAGRACTTPAALTEYLAAPSVEAWPADAWCDLPIVELTTAEEDLAVSLSARLGPGERACLAVAIARSGILASDDLDARGAAARHGVVVTGTLGLLILAAEAARHPPYGQRPARDHDRCRLSFPRRHARLAAHPSAQVGMWSTISRPARNKLPDFLT